MALDPRIALGVQPLQMQSPMQGAQQYLTLRDLMASAAARGEQRDYYQQQRQAAAHQAQMRQGFFQAFQASGGKMTPELAALGGQAGISPADMQSLSGVSNWNRPEVARTVDVAGGDSGKQTVQLDKYGQRVGDAFDAPVELRRFDAGGVSIAENPYNLAEQGRTVKTLTPDAVLTDQRTRSEGAANRAMTARGQNLTDARARAEQEFRLQNPTRQWMETPDGVVGIDTRGVAPTIRGVDAAGKPLPGKPLTESQANSFNYANRMIESHKALTELEGVLDNVDITQLAVKEGLGKTWVVGGALGAGANKMLLGENEQKYEQAKRDFINAVLRKESGAVIADVEFANADKQYFPQPGDSKAVIDKKRENRSRAIQGIASGAGPRQPDILRGLGEYEFERKKNAKKGGQKAEGNIGGAPAAGGDAPDAPQEFDNMPDPAQYRGQIMRDSATGDRYRSDGRSWKKVQ